ncbi:MAG: hypothetical protein V4634_23305 [Pseudomonadota bacterium]
MSLTLLLEDFLGLMREEGELDKFLPLLLSGMGHHIVWLSRTESPAALRSSKRYIENSYAGLEQSLS